MKTSRVLIRLVLAHLCAFCLFLSGCSSKPDIEQEQAILIAKREATKKGWKEIEVRNARFESSRWVITLCEVPKSPGGFAIVEVSDKGEIIRFLPGY